MQTRTFFLLAISGAAFAYVATRAVQEGGIEEGFAAIEKDIEAVTGPIERLVERFEGWSETPYLDEAGLWTIGYGHLIVAGDGYWHPEHNPDGIKKIDRAQGAAQLAKDMRTAENAVSQYVTVPITENQRAALVSLAFNIGAGAFGGSTLVKKLNAGDVAGAAEQFKVWNKVTKDGTLVASAGLTSRRATERETFLS